MSILYDKTNNKYLKPVDTRGQTKGFIDTIQKHILQEHTTSSVYKPITSMHTDMHT